MLRVLVAVFLLVLASSCFEEGDCLITNSHVVKVSLMTFKDKTKPAKILFDSVYIPGYTPPLYKNVTVETLDLPVNPAANEMTFVFKYQGKTDVLELRYDNHVVIPSPTCGALIYQKNLLVTQSTFGQDSLVVTNQSLLRDVDENAQIYF